MYLAIISLWIGLLGLLGGVHSQCTPEQDYSNVISQADADAFNKCDTINGTISITLPSRTSLLSMDNIKHITGTLELLPAIYGTPFDVSTLSMKSLISVGAGVRIYYGSSLSTLNFPSLTTIGGDLSLKILHNLSTVTIPSLTSVGALEFDELPNLKTVNFSAGLQHITGYQDPQVEGSTYPYFLIINTSLTSISGLAFPTAELQITNNLDLQDVTIPVETVNCGPDVIGVDITVNPVLNLNLPNLKIINCTSSTFDISTLSIPALTTINGSLEIRPFYGTLFSAPSLISVSQGFDIEEGRLTNISLPALQTVGEFFFVNSNPAVLVENGLFMPNITNVTNFGITAGLDQQPACQVLDNYRCRGLMTGEYSCGGDFVNVAMDPGSCKDTYPAYGWTLAKKLKVGLGTALGTVAVVSVCMLGCWWWMRKRKARRCMAVGRKDETGEEGEELPKYRAEDDESGPIPPYETREAAWGEEGVNEAVAAGDAVSADERVQEPEAYESGMGGEEPQISNEGSREVVHDAI